MSRRPRSSQPSSHPMRDRRYRRYRPRLVMKRAWPPELKLMKDVRRLVVMVALPAVLLTEKPTEPLLLTTMLALLAVLVASNIVEPLLLMMLAVPAVLAPVKFVSPPPLVVIDVPDMS